MFWHFSLFRMHLTDSKSRRSVHLTVTTGSFYVWRESGNIQKLFLQSFRHVDVLMTYDALRRRRHLVGVTFLLTCQHFLVKSRSNIHKKTRCIAKGCKMTICGLTNEYKERKQLYKLMQNYHTEKKTQKRSNYTGTQSNQRDAKLLSRDVK